MTRIVKVLLGLLVLANVDVEGNEPSARGVGVRLRVQGQEVQLYTESHALIMGASDYTGGWSSLPGVKKDIDLVKAALEKQGFTTKVVLNPTRHQLEQAVRQFISDYGQEAEARLLIYFAGHGHTLTTLDERQLGFVVPVDAPRPSRENTGPFKSLAVSMTDFENIALQIESKHVLFIFDSCFSGSIFEATRAIPDDISEKTTRPVRQFITAGSAEQTVPDKSIFRAELIEGIEGAADTSPKDGYVTGSELGQHLQSKVTIYSRRAQTPEYGKLSRRGLDRGDFVFKTVEPALAAAITTSPPDDRVIELALWESIKNETDPAYFREYLQKYPKGQFATVAALKMRPPVPAPAKPSAPSVASAGSSVGAGVETEKPEYLFDERTKLLWTAKDNGRDISWGQANTYCKELTIDGRTGWRLPSIDELPPPMYDAAKRPYKGPISLSADWLWSSTMKNANQAWSFDVYSGKRYGVFPANAGSQRAVCVRATDK